MGKAPAFQWYPNDYIRDTRILSLLSRGAWADMLNFMWYSVDRGTLTGTPEQLARMLSCSIPEINTVLDELNVTKVADVTKSNGIVTVLNRRMVRDEKERKSTRLRVKKFRNGQCNDSSNESVTPPSSTSSSSSPIKNNKYTPNFLKFYNLYPNKKEKKAAFKIWERLNGQLPEISILLTAIQKQIDWRKNANGEFRPEWKNPATWLNKGCWEDETNEVKTGSAQYFKNINS